MRAFGVWLIGALSIAGCGLEVAGGGSEQDETRDRSRPSTKSPPASEVPRPAGESKAPRPEGPTGEGAGPTTPQAVDVPSTLSPWEPSGKLTFERPIAWTIAAFDPEAPIRFTTDGSPPGAAPVAGRGLVTVPGVDRGKILWTAGDSPTVHSFEVDVDQNLRAKDHYIVENVRFDTTRSTVVHAKPGEKVFTQAAVTVWSWCPGCWDQVLVGIDRAEACVVNVQATHETAQPRNVAFELTAPKKPGVYKVRAGFAQQYSCADALAKDYELDPIEVATIIVE